MAVVCVCATAMQPTDLQGEKALVDLGPLQTGLPVSAGSVSPSLVPGEVDEGELAVHFPVGPEDDLEDGVAAGGVGVGGSLPWCSGKTREERESKVKGGGELFCTILEQISLNI